MSISCKLSIFNPHLLMSRINFNFYPPISQANNINNKFI